MLPVFLSVLAVVFVGLAFATSWLWLWPAVVLIATTIVYVLGTPGAFFKRADGTLPWYAWLVRGPMTWSQH